MMNCVGVKAKFEIWRIKNTNKNLRKFVKLYEYVNVPCCMEKTEDELFCIILFVWDYT